jgi:charged multivesicular body protein 2A
MAEALSNTAKAMGKMNKAINVPTITKMMTEFERENAKAEMMQEMMGDAIDDALADDNNEDEEDKIVSQVLDEIGISFGEALPEAANMTIQSNTNNTIVTSPNKIAQPAMAGSNGGSANDDDPALSELEARLNNLKK